MPLQRLLIYTVGGHLITLQNIERDTVEQMKRGLENALTGTYDFQGQGGGLLQLPWRNIDFWLVIDQDGPLGSGAQGVDITIQPD